MVLHGLCLAIGPGGIAIALRSWLLLGGGPPAQIHEPHWRALARDCGLAPRQVLRLVEEIRERLLDAFAPTREAFETACGPAPALQRVATVLRKSARPGRARPTPAPGPQGV